MVTDGAASGPGAATGTIPVLTPRGGGVEIRLDEHTGLPATFAAHAGGPVIPLRFGIELETDGDERTGTTGGLAYVNTRSFLPEIRLGRVDYEAVSVADVAIYGVLRHDPRRATLVAVNTSSRSLRTTISVSEAAVPNPQATRMLDAWTGEWLPTGVAQDGVLRFDLTFGPYQPRAIVLGAPPSELIDQITSAGALCAGATRSTMPVETPDEDGDLSRAS